MNLKDDNLDQLATMAWFTNNILIKTKTFFLGGGGVDVKIVLGACMCSGKRGN